MTEPKEVISVRLNPLTVCALQEIGGVTTMANRSDSVRDFLEHHLQIFMFNFLKDKFTRGRIKLDMPFDELVQLFIDYQKLMRKEKGYEAVMGKALTYHENDDEKKKLQELRQMPLKIVSIKTPDKK